MKETGVTLLNSSANRTLTNPASIAGNVPCLTGKLLLDRYRVGERINTGSGEAFLYLATGDNSGSEFLVKQYFRKNAISTSVLKKLSRLDIATLPEIAGYGETDGFTFTVTARCRGESLDRVLARGITFSFEQLKSRIIPSLVETVNTIHSLGIVHRDIKPANIVMNPEELIPVLVDFGISTETADRSIVVTTMENTPCYAAPETVHGVFSVYSDYYSLGICIYELFTGRTPFQDLAAGSEDYARYAQLEKVRYPGNFPEELADLIDGLTYKDLSNRDCPDNPNRRWGYEEVQRWLRGEKQPVPGRSAGPQEKHEFAIAYHLEDQTFYCNHELAAYFFRHWYLGVRELGRGYLTRHYENNRDYGRMELCRRAETELTQQDNRMTVLYRLLYQLAGGIKQIYWKNFCFESLQDFGNRLIDSILENPATVLVQSAEQLLEDEVLKVYAQIQLKEQMEPLPLQRLINLFEDCRNMFSCATVEKFRLALRFARTLTGREDFIIGAQIYRSLDDFSERMEKLYETDLPSFLKYMEDYRKELEEHASLLPEDERRRFEKFLIPGRQNDCAGSGGMFRKTEDELKYLQQAWHSGKLEQFHRYFSEGTDSQLAAVRNTDPEEFARMEHLFRGMIVIDEHYFRDLKDFSGYVIKLADWQVNYNVHTYDSFRAEHERTISEMSSRSPEFAAVWEELLHYYEQKVKCDGNEQNNNFSAAGTLRPRVGQIIKFGSYFTADRQTLEPLRWKVLQIADSTALIITELAVDCNRFSSDPDSSVWLNSELRKWCNGAFYNLAFSPLEKARLELTDVNTGDERTSQDYVFCLSADEAGEYFRDDGDRICNPSRYARECNREIQSGGAGWWWLRTPGRLSGSVSFVDREGRINRSGIGADAGTGYIRPACRIRLE